MKNKVRKCAPVPVGSSSWLATPGDILCLGVHPSLHLQWQWLLLVTCTSLGDCFFSLCPSLLCLIFHSLLIILPHPFL